MPVLFICLKLILKCSTHCGYVGEEGMEEGILKEVMWGRENLHVRQPCILVLTLMIICQ